MNFINKLIGSISLSVIVLMHFSLIAMEMRFQNISKSTEFIKSEYFPKIEISYNYNNLENTHSFSKLPLDPSVQEYFQKQQYEELVQKQLQEINLEQQRLKFREDQQSGSIIKTVPDPDKQQSNVPFHCSQTNVNAPLNLDEKQKANTQVAEQNSTQLNDTTQLISAQQNLNSKLTTIPITFMITDHAASVIKEYGKDPNKLIAFRPKTFDQLVIHDFVIDSINRHANKLASSKNLYEQILLIQTIDNLIKVSDLNIRNQLPYIDQVLSEAWKQYSPTIIKFTINVIKKFSTNISHPIDYLKQRIIGLHDIAIVMTNKAIGYLIPVKHALNSNFDEINLYAKECAQRLNANPKELSATVADIITDMTFDGGLGLMRKSVATTLKQIQKLALTVENAAKKINVLAQKEKQVVVASIEGTKTSLKIEVNQVKQCMQQAAKETVKQTKNIVEKEAQDLAKQSANSSLTKIEEVVRTTKEVNQGSTAILKNGYYEVNGFKLTEYYYNRLWNKGRKAPTLLAKDMIENATSIIKDEKYPGFYIYICNGWEMAYNPITKIIAHLSPITKTK
jgi:hypothetical protein